MDWGDLSRLTWEERQAVREQLVAETAALRRDNEERRARRLREEAEAPPPEPPKPEPVKPPEPDHVEKRILALADICGEELALRENAIRADAKDREAVIRKSVEEVRTEVHLTADRLRTEFRDSTARSATKLLELREIRESAMHDLQKQIFEIQREVFLLRQALAHERGLGPKPNGALQLSYEQ